jgi:hypothetical protein
MDDFHTLKKQVFGHELVVQALAKCNYVDAIEAEVQVKVEYQGESFEVSTRGPITHPIHLGSDNNTYPEEQIRQELQLVSDLFTQHYSPNRIVIAVIMDTLVAYRNLTTPKLTHHVTDGNS